MSWRKKVQIGCAILVRDQETLWGSVRRTCNTCEPKADSHGREEFTGHSLLSICPVASERRASEHACPYFLHRLDLVQPRIARENVGIEGCQFEAALSRFLDVHGVVPDLMIVGHARAHLRVQPRIAEILEDLEQQFDAGVVDLAQEIGHSL